VDRDPALVALARKKAMAARVAAKFVVDDVTNLQNVSGPFDVLVDYSTLDDLTPEERDRYVQNVLPLTQPGTQFVIYCLEWALSWWEKLTLRALSPFGLGQLILEPGEVMRLFNEQFPHPQGCRGDPEARLPARYAVYLMTRKASLTAAIDASLKSGERRRTSSAAFHYIPGQPTRSLAGFMMHSRQLKLAAVSL